MIIFVIHPTAPPSAIPELDIVDTMAIYGSLSYQMGTDPFRNTVTAMPSVHVIYAAIAGFGFAKHIKYRWLRISAIAYVPLSVLVTIVTGNHYVADVAGAGVILAIAFPSARALQRILKRSQTVSTP